MQGHIHPQAGLAGEAQSCQQTLMLHSLVLKDVASDPLKQYTNTLCYLLSAPTASLWGNASLLANNFATL